MRLLIYIFLISSFGAQATVYTSINDGDWDVAANWDANGIPPFNIPNGDIVNVKHNIDYEANELKVSGELNVHAIGVLTGTKKLTVETDGTATNEGTIDIGTQEIHVDGQLNNGAYVYANKFHLDGSSCNSGLIKLTDKFHLHGGTLTCCGSILVDKIKVEDNGGNVANTDCQNICNYTNTANPTFEGNVTSTIFIDNSMPSESITTNNTTLCDFSIGILPVTISLIYGQNIGRDNLINWETASEINNDYFTILKSTDLENWISIGTVQGFGNSNETIKYEFKDDKVNSERNYYQLRQTDYDGSVTFSKIISIDSELESIKPFPNPVSSTLNIYNKSNYIVELYDKIGNSISLDNKVITNGSYSEVNFSAFEPGIYFIIMNGEVYKVIKI